MHRTLAFALAAAAVAAAALPATVSAAREAASTPSARAGAEMQVATLIVRATRFGPMLFDGKRRALYAFTRDKRGGASTCYGACAAAWPVYFAKGKPVAGRGVNKSLIGTTRRRGGRLQLTYNGWPLYYYAADNAAGDTNGQGVGEVWYVIGADGEPISE
jgi:predicted lipoprotein with Yx(FWY)xxD motif